MAAQFGGVGNLNYLEQSVFDDRVGKAGGNIGYFRAFFLRLFHFGIHKHGTAGAQIYRVLRKQGGVGEILHAVVQGFGEGLDKGAAAGGAGLIELDAVHRMIFDFDTFHILSANIENTVHGRVEKGCGIVVSHCFHFAVIQQECGFHQCFSISGGAGTDNFHIRRQFCINIPDGADCRF